MEHKIKILDNGESRYLVDPAEIILGRQYDNLADTIVIERPLAEIGNACVMMITDINGKAIDSIILNGDTYTILNNVSKHRHIRIGFAFMRADGYNKSSQIITGQFLPAQCPENFVEVTPEQVKNINQLLQYGIVNIKLVGNELQAFNSSGDKVVSFDFSPFTQEQVDLGETNEKSETFVKGKVLSNLENDVGFITKSTLSLENYYGKNETYTREEVKSEIKQEMATLTATQVRNKTPYLVVETSDSELQTVATQYIVDNYSRQPQEYDGLYLTLTDHENQVVEFAYHNNAWIPTGFDKVDLSNYMDLTSEQRIGGRKVFENETQFLSPTEFDDDISLNNSSVKTTDITKDMVTYYSADGIRQESGSNGTTKDFEFPDNGGKLALKDECVKAQTANAGELKAYCISGSNSHDVCLITNVGKANCIARYATSGQLKSSVNPVEDNDLVRLAYIKDKINHAQVYFGTTLPTAGIGTTYLENDVFVLNNSNGTKNFYQLKTPTGSATLTWIDQVDFEKPKWQILKPNDTSQILATKITISACSNHTEFVGASKMIKGYVQDGADDWVINSLTSSGSIPTSFIGKIYKTYIQGIHLTPNQTIAYTNETGTDLATFTYEYLW